MLKKMDPARVLGENELSVESKSLSLVPESTLPWLPLSTFSNNHNE